MSDQVDAARGRARDDAAVERSSWSPNWYSVSIRASLVVALTVVGLVLYTREGDRYAVLAVADTVPAGHVIEPADLREVRLSRDAGVRTVPASDKARVVGMVANGTLFSGSTLTWGALSERSRAVGEDEAVVGFSLKPGSFPGELRPGDTVRVVQAGSSSGIRPEDTVTLVESARVLSVRKTDRGAEGSVLVSLAVPAKQSAEVAAGSAAGRISLAVTRSV